MFFSPKFVVLLVAAMAFATPTPPTANEQCVMNITALAKTLGKQCGTLTHASTEEQASRRSCRSLATGSPTAAQCTTISGDFSGELRSPVINVLGCFKKDESIFHELGDDPLVKTNLISFKAETLAYLKELAFKCKALASAIAPVMTAMGATFDNATYPYNH
ncbi:hypothetical protein C8R46DRAFT_1228906 [Mycena filopes]|nr:hypothetical protein C8R46DRAFT_1228906 [Mycena filopes]